MIQLTNAFIANDKKISLFMNIKPANIAAYSKMA
jgi:hypothetical protein